MPMPMRANATGVVVLPWKKPAGWLGLGGGGRVLYCPPDIYDRRVERPTQKEKAEQVSQQVRGRPVGRSCRGLLFAAFFFVRIFGSLQLVSY